MCERCWNIQIEIEDELQTQMLWNLETREGTSVPIVRPNFTGFYQVVMEQIEHIPQKTGCLNDRIEEGDHNILLSMFILDWNGMDSAISLYDIQSIRLFVGEINRSWSKGSDFSIRKGDPSCEIARKRPNRAIYSSFDGEWRALSNGGVHVIIARDSMEKIAKNYLQTLKNGTLCASLLIKWY